MLPKVMEKTYLLFPKLEPTSTDPKDLMERYRVSARDCLIMEPRKSISEYPETMILLVWSHTDSWNLKACPTVKQIMDRRKVKIASGPIPELEDRQPKTGETGPGQGPDRDKMPA